MIFFNVLATEPSDPLVREAQQHSVTALEWNKHRLFSGFSSGKVLMTTVKLNKVIVDVFQQEFQLSFGIYLYFLFVYTKMLYYILQLYHELSFLNKEIYIYQIML